MSRSVLRSCVFVPLLIGAVADSASGQESDRVWTFSAEEVRVIGQDEPLFGLPTLIVGAPDGGFFVSDRGDSRVHRFDAEGQRLWSFGGRGAGPGEFAMVGSLNPLPDGSVQALDLERGRVTVISAVGTLHSDLRIPGRAERLLPPSGSYDVVVSPSDGSDLWVAFDDGGAPIERYPLPGNIRLATPIVGESFTTSSDMGSVVAFRWSSLLLFLDEDLRPRGSTDGVDQLGFPDLDRSIPGVTRVDRSNGLATRDVTAADGLVFILAGRSPDPKSRTVDVYDENRMTYVGSLRLPAPAHGIAALGDGRLATIESDLIPVVRIWQFTAPQ